MYLKLPAPVAAVAFFALMGCVSAPPVTYTLPRQPAPKAGTTSVLITQFTPPPREKGTLDKVLPDGYRASRMVHVAGVGLVPIHATGAVRETEYLTLDEALTAGSFTVTELGGGTVNTLSATNQGTRPVFLMAGDLVLGGKQDRILAASLVIEPGATNQEIRVFCVEHGRWTAQAGGMSFGNDAAKGQVDISVKRAAVGSNNQSEVWRAVANSNASFGVTADGGSFRATYDSDEVAHKLEQAMREARPARDGQAVGYAVVLDDEVVAMDLFESVGLCTKLSEKLLRSYLISALGGGYNRPEDHPLVAPLQDRVTIEFTAVPLSQAIAALDDKWRARLTFTSRHFNPVINFKAGDQTMAELIDGLCLHFGLCSSLATTDSVALALPLEDMLNEREALIAGIETARELYRQSRFNRARQVLLDVHAQWRSRTALGRAADVCLECAQWGRTPQLTATFDRELALARQPAYRAVPGQAACNLDDVTFGGQFDGGTGNCGGFWFEDVGGQFDNGSGGLGASGSYAGIFFNNADLLSPPVNFSQDIRGRFEHLLGRALGGQLRGSRGQTWFTTSLGVGTPVALQQQPSAPIEHDCKDPKRNSTVHRGYMRR